MSSYFEYVQLNINVVETHTKKVFDEAISVFIILRQRDDIVVTRSSNRYRFENAVDFCRIRPSLSHYFFSFPPPSPFKEMVDTRWAVSFPPHPHGTRAWPSLSVRERSSRSLIRHDDARTGLKATSFLRSSTIGRACKPSIMMTMIAKQTTSTHYRSSLLAPMPAPLTVKTTDAATPVTDSAVAEKEADQQRPRHRACKHRRCRGRHRQRHEALQ